MDLLLHRKVVVVTGAARGIGLAIGRAFLEEGARAILVDRDAERLKAIAPLDPDRGSTICTDICDPAAPVKIMDFALERYGRVDILVNNAGINRPGKFIEMTPEDLRRVFDVNFFAPYFLAQEFVRRCIKAEEAVTPGFRIEEAVILNMASIMASEVDAGLSAYCPSKAAVLRLSECISRELGPKYKMRCIALAPGFIDTELLGNLRPEDKEKIAGRTHLRRLGAPEEIARLAVFLASPCASYMTGSEVRVNAGYKP